MNGFYPAFGFDTTKLRKGVWCTMRSKEEGICLYALNMSTASIGVLELKLFYTLNNSTMEETISGSLS